ncbi:MAG: hypothetical protein HY681_01730 [Chloroflexi bacterium]|nr:hypothetical protein [Chloroflexota bacterium]
MTTANSKEALRRAIERGLADYLEGRKTQRGIIGDIQASNLRGKDLAAIFDGVKGRGDAAKYDAAVRECQSRGWL